MNSKKKATTESRRGKVRAALDATGQAYIAVFIEPGTERAVTMATLAEDQVPHVLMGIAVDLQKGFLQLNRVEPSRGQG